LQQVGSTQYLTTQNTGEVTYNKPGTNNVGNTTANYLEMSNVDISKEFTEMITTQRGFQANTRIVTVSDEMLNELVNLKR
jgi:flagellar hook protein FlgE